jgi:hypothetical protein
VTRSNATHEKKNEKKKKKEEKKKRMFFSLLLFLGLVVAQQANVSVSNVNDLPANLASNTAYRFMQTVALTAPATSVVGHRDGSSVLDCSAVGFCFSFAGAGAGMQNFSLDNVAVLATPVAGLRTFVVGVSVASSVTATNLSNIRYEKAATLQFPTLSLVQLATNATSAFVGISNVQALSVVSLVEPALDANGGGVFDITLQSVTASCSLSCVKAFTTRSLSFMRITGSSLIFSGTTGPMVALRGASITVTRSRLNSTQRTFDLVNCSSADFSFTTFSSLPQLSSSSVSVQGLSSSSVVARNLTFIGHRFLFATNVTSLRAVSIAANISNVGSQPGRLVGVSGEGTATLTIEDISMVHVAGTVAPLIAECTTVPVCRVGEVTINGVRGHNARLLAGIVDVANEASFRNVAFDGGAALQNVGDSCVNLRNSASVVLENWSIARVLTPRLLEVTSTATTVLVQNVSVTDCRGRLVDLISLSTRDAAVTVRDLRLRSVDVSRVLVATAPDQVLVRGVHMRNCSGNDRHAIEAFQCPDVDVSDVALENVATFRSAAAFDNNGRVTLKNMSCFECNMTGTFVTLQRPAAPTTDTTVDLSDISVRNSVFKFNILYVERDSNTVSVLRLSRATFENADTEQSVVRVLGVANSTFSDVSVTDCSSTTHAVYVERGSTEIVRFRASRLPHGAILLRFLSATLSDLDLAEVAFRCQGTLAATPIAIENVASFALSSASIACGSRCENASAGAIYFATVNTIRMTDVRVSNCVGMRAGAFFHSRGSNVTCERCLVVGNRGPSAAALFWESPDPNALLSIVDSTLIRNRGGPAVSLSASARLTCQNSSFFDNSGGAVLADRARVLVDRCYFAQNKALNSSGGALNLLTHSEVTVTNSDFVGNEAVVGSAIFSTGSNVLVTLVNVSVVGNVGKNVTGTTADTNYRGALSFVSQPATVFRDVCACGNVWETTEASDIFYRSGQARRTEWRQVRWSGNRTFITNNTAVLDVSMCSGGAADCVERVPELRRSVVALLMMLTSTTKPSTLTLPSGATTSGVGTTTSGLSVTTSPVQTAAENAGGFDNTAAIVGGAIGAVVVVAAAVGLVVAWKKRRSASPSKAEGPATTGAGSVGTSIYGSFPEMASARDYESSLRALD